MKISYNWLKQYINCNLPAEEVAKALTDTGLEVEDMHVYESIKGSLNGIVVGKVIHCTEHPNSDHLHITRVDIGAGAPLAIVCGAPNIAEGQTVLVATVGTTLYADDESFQIKKSKIRGELSEGMICSEKELGLGNSHAGIMVLPDHYEAGKPARAYFEIEEDVVFEIGLTPNRSDATSHIGIARDLLAALNQRSQGNTYVLTYPDVNDFKADNHTIPAAIEIDNTEACPRYSGVTMSGIVVEPSPKWLQDRLQSVGIRSINNIVDISNYVLMETGQPLHVFDMKTIKGNKIIVKTVDEGTPFVTLDDVERKLSAHDLMICDAEKPLCIAGVFGGKDSGVTEKTTDIFIESAYFDSRWIRKTARRHGLQTDASFRFERGADPNITVYALKRAAMLIKGIAGGQISSEIKDVCACEFTPVQITLHFQYLNKVAGQPIPKDTAIAILVNLGCKITAMQTDAIMVEVPTFKVDVYRPADLVEEILRIYGYDNINIPSKINLSLNANYNLDFDKQQHRIADMLSANGFYEIMNNSLTKSAYGKLLNEIDENKYVRLLNPLSSDLDVLRQTLIFGGLETIAYNQNRKNTDLKLYEFGNTYTFDSKAEQTETKPLNPYTEQYMLAIFMTGNKEAEAWNQPAQAIGFFDIKHFTEAVFHKSGIDTLKIVTTEYQSEFYDYALSYTINEKQIGIVGKVSKKLQKAFDIKKEVYHASIYWDILLKLFAKQKTLRFESISKFPSVRRDLALVIDKNVSFDALQKVAYKAESNLLQAVNIFDVYEGDKIPEGKKSYALSFILEDKDKTLTDKVIEKTMAKIQKAIEEQLGAVLR
ncbi:MAG: phenylalanine--tRNA ligase subunit beta [Lentimicrobiaceae bacterium]|jgi:phenylalanyl-tRNA synthetase beta chain|nr:phenylalanine--tRNA ligase subunit beta [Lentimicrobiaceae bacterium]